MEDCRKCNDMETLVISPDFTIEDIHKIREQNYERTKDMTVAENENVKLGEVPTDLII